MNALYNNIRCMKSINLFTKRNLAHTPGEDLLNYYKSIIGNRETVGFGINGTPCYLDNPGIPMPAIRYKEPTAEILVSFSSLLLLLLLIRLKLFSLN